MTEEERVAKLRAELEKQYQDAAQGGGSQAAQARMLREAAWAQILAADAQQQSSAALKAAADAQREGVKLQVESAEAQRATADAQKDAALSQRGAARWTKWMAIATFVLALLTAFAVFFSMKSALATQDSIKQTREMFELQRRPWLSIEPETVLVIPGRDSLHFPYTVRNFGQGAADCGPIAVVIDTSAEATLRTETTAEGVAGPFLVPGGMRRIDESLFCREALFKGPHDVYIHVALIYWGYESGKWYSHEDVYAVKFDSVRTTGRTRYWTTTYRKATYLGEVRGDSIILEPWGRDREHPGRFKGR